MPKFMFLYRGECKRQQELSPEQMQQAMEGWRDWIEGGKQAGWLLDAGDGLKPEGRVLRPDRTVTDGPFAESKELVGGYCMIEAADLDAAETVALSMPDTGGNVEIRELAGQSMG